MLSTTPKKDVSIAVMQPYIFPYVGYFQLIYAVDEFVFYDDVNFIKQGWINRNRLLSNGKDCMFTIPLDKASSFTEIKDLSVHPILYAKWKKKFLKGIEQSYKKAPHFSPVYKLICEVMETPQGISDMAESSITSVMDYLAIKKNVYKSSLRFKDSKGLDRADRLIEICKKTGARTYVNLIGGAELYSNDYFNLRGVTLQFLKPSIEPYKQFKDDFVPGLSIIDVLMFNSKDECIDLFNTYEIV